MSQILKLESCSRPLFRHQNPAPAPAPAPQKTGLGHDCSSTEEIEQLHDHTNIAIPVLDFQCLNLDRLEEACEDRGFFRLVNHGIPETLLAQLRDHAQDLFSLTIESKQQLFTTPISYFSGTPALTPSGAALSLGPQNINWVQGLHFPLTQLSQFQGGNPILDSFRILLEEYGRHLARLATTIFDAMVKNLNLDQEQSKSYLSDSTGFIRVYRYPQYSMDNEMWGINAHTDSSLLSILNQDQVGGLQVLKDDNWVHVKPIPSTLILNLGDMMQAISSDEYKSVKHRVKVHKDEERFSICYFVFPADGCVIQNSKYKPFTYVDFQSQVQEDIRNLGFKVGLERFRLTDAG